MARALLGAAVQLQRLDEPEGAVERGLRFAEVVGLDVAEEVALLQVALDGLEGLHPARVHRVQEAQVGHLQQRGVQLAVAEAGCEAALVGDEGLLALDPFPMIPPARARPRRAGAGR